jgi:hypothetical protein
MKKAKKTKKVPQRPTELDRIAAQLRTMLRRDTTSIIEKGKLLRRSRELLADDKGWQEWLAENFDLSYRTAHRYESAAEYVERKSDTVSHFANLSPTVLYRLAEGHFDERVEAAILAEARKRRIDEDAMWAIKDKVEPDDDDEADDQRDGDEDDDEDGDEDHHDSGDERDAESEAILDRGADPAVPPPAPNPPPPDFALRDFDQAISALNRLKTKPSTQFAQTIHSADDLESVEDFIHAVMKVLRDALLAARNG